MPLDLDDPRLTAYALGELDQPDSLAIEALLNEHDEARRFVEEVRATAQLLADQLRAEPSLGLAPEHHEAIKARLGTSTSPRFRPSANKLMALAASLLIAVLVGSWFLPGFQATRKRDRLALAPPAWGDEVTIVGGPVREKPLDFTQLKRSGTRAADPPNEAAPVMAPRPEREFFDRTDDVAGPGPVAPSPPAPALGPGRRGLEPGQSHSRAQGALGPEQAAAGASQQVAEREANRRLALSEPLPTIAMKRGAIVSNAIVGKPETVEAANPRSGPAQSGGHPGEVRPQRESGLSRYAFIPAPSASPAATQDGAAASVGRKQPADQFGRGDAGPAAGPETRAALSAGEIRFGTAGTSDLKHHKGRVDDLALYFKKDAEREGSRLGLAERLVEEKRKAPMDKDTAAKLEQLAAVQLAQKPQGPNREGFTRIVDSPFLPAIQHPQSTFGIDVDTASYAIVRRYLMQQSLLPPPDAVRLEEMVNAFRYDDAEPRDGDEPFAVTVEIARCPWKAEHRLARIALQAQSLDQNDRAPGNLVFLVDASGSMADPDKLPLLKYGLRVLTEQLGEGDRVAIVAYSNTAKVVLDATPGDRKAAILSALNELKAQGSTNGAAGLVMAYDLAARHFIPEGTNRVILATDGDFNVGVTAHGDLVRLIEEKAKTRVYLTVLGFGRGNLQDTNLEAIADKGDGQYHYIDSEREARKVLVEQLAGTLVTVAKDVKIQVDFNPVKVAAYRRIGFENRALAAQDFNDPRKDAGDLGAGHNVTALYELVPPGEVNPAPKADAPEFVKPAAPADPEAPESFVVKLNWKAPEGGDQVRSMRVPALDAGKDYADASPDFKFAAAVASFGMLLRDSPDKGTATLAAVLELAQASRGSDPRGERAEFLELVRKAQALLNR